MSHKLMMDLAAGKAKKSVPCRNNWCRLDKQDTQDFCGIQKELFHIYEWNSTEFFSIGRLFDYLYYLLLNVIDIRSMYSNTVNSLPPIINTVFVCAYLS